MAGAGRTLYVMGGDGSNLYGTSFGGAGGKVSLIAGSDIAFRYINAGGGYGYSSNNDGSGHGVGGDVRVYALGGDVAAK